MAHVTAAVTAYNRPGFISVCLRSVLDSVKDDLDVSVVVIDNGSADSTGEVAASFGERVRVVRNERNMPLAYASNQCIRAGLDDPKAEYLFIMNDDTSLRPGCLRRLVDASQHYPDGLFTPLQLEYKEPHNIDRGMGVHHLRELVQDAVLRRPLQLAYSVPFLIGTAGTFGRCEVFANIGEFDPLFRHYGLEKDHFQRAKFLGYPFYLVPEAHMLHAHGVDREPSTGGEWDRWCRVQHGRFLNYLKDPKRPLWQNYLCLTGLTLREVWISAAKFKLNGGIYMFGTYLRMLALAPQIRRAYRAHFDPAKKGCFGPAREQG